MFTLSKDIPVIIYGAAYQGVTTYRLFEKNGFRVVAFIDRRAEEIKEKLGLPVWSINAAKTKVDCKKSCIVVIAIKNVFAHQDIANELADNGFCNLLYRPEAVLAGGGTQRERDINHAYSLALSGQADGAPLSETHERSAVVLDDCATIEREDGQRVVLVPVELLYTIDGHDDSALWTDIPMLASFPHNRLYSFLQGYRNDGYAEYVDFCKWAAQNTGDIEMTEAWEQNLLETRRDIYENMNGMLGRQPMFFCKNSAMGQWNEKGYFNMISGKNRAAFLMSKGFYCVPLRITESDYEKWVNMKEFLLCRDAVEARCAKGVRAPYAHPYMLSLKCLDMSFYRSYAAKVIDELAGMFFLKDKNPGLRDLNVLTAFDDEGFLSRIFSRMRCNVHRICEDSEFLQMLDRLEYAARIKDVEQAENLTYDISLVDLSSHERADAWVEMKSKTVVATYLTSAPLDAAAVFNKSNIKLLFRGIKAGQICDTVLCTD